MTEGFKQTDIGLIPEDWEIKKIEDSFSFTKKPRSLEISSDVEVPFIPMELIPDNKIYVEDFELKSFGSFSSGTYFENGDMLLAKITPSFENGKQAIARIPYDFGYATTEVIPINEMENVSSKHFLFNYLLKSEIRKTLAGKMEGSTGRQRLPKSVLQNTLIPLPPLPEQKKIAHVLSKIQQATETQEQIIKTTQELKKALMQKLFTEGSNGEPQKQTEIGLIPESWEVVPLRDAVAYIDYGLSEAIPKNQDFEGVKNVSTADITREGKLLYQKVRKVQTTDRIIERLKLKDGDILFNWRNSSELIGKTTIYNQQPETHIFASFILRIRCDEIKYHNYFLSYLMNHYREQGIFIQLSRRAVNQANYNRNEIYVLKIPSPSYKEQVQVANAFRKMDEKIALQNEKLNTKKQLFSNILNQLMTGQIRVNDVKFKLKELEYN